jgi:hypothetical protein
MFSSLYFTLCEISTTATKTTKTNSNNNNDKQQKDQKVQERERTILTDDPSFVKGERGKKDNESKRLN